ncbi:MAG: hypothetical protein KGL39_45170 [Patescibacteria group bacterium]|nr:hypothetical protein [Patescibacteria group bacterium]
MLHVNNPTATISATTTSSLTAYPQNNNSAGVYVSNSGTVPAFLQSGGSSVVATVGGGQVVLAGQTAYFLRNPDDTHLAAITASGTATVYFCNSSALKD